MFNVGEHVLGTTTPLFALIVGVLHRLTAVDYVILAFVVAVASHAATCALIATIGRRCQQPAAGCLAGCLYALSPTVLGTVLGCMETSTFVLASVYALAGTQRPLDFSRNLAASLSLLLRPEGGLVVGLHLLEAARISFRSARSAAVVVAVTVLPWMAFATWYFGSPVPQSMVAKLGHPLSFAPLLAAENFWFVLVSIPLALPLVGHALETIRPIPFG
ncbi:MAG TPA: hypothetical protein VMT89_03790, partial [Candidatus Acidoferrales bacterium]|nr:hypothetical protein [Candidatus Acidoferrales bacterium]